MQLRRLLATVIVSVAASAIFAPTASAGLCPNPGPSGACDRSAFDLRAIPENWRTMSEHATASDTSVIGVKLRKVAGGSSVKFRLIGCESHNPIISATKTVREGESVKLRMDGSSWNCFRLSFHGNGSATNIKGVLIYPAA